MYPESGKRSGFESPESDKKSPIGEKAESRPAFSRTNTASSDRKAGFDPNMRGGQWEPQAQNSSAYNTSYHRAAPPPPANKAGPRPRPQNPKIFTNGSPNRDTASDVRSPEDVPYVEGAPRLPKHYHEVGGEKTYFSSEALKRSNSTRDAPGLNKEALHPKRGTGASHKTQSRARSASPPSRLKPDHASSRPSQTRPATNDGSQTAPRPTAPKKKTTFYAGNSSSSEEVPFTGAANSGLENARHGGRHTTSTGSPASVSQPTEAQASAFWRTRNQDPPPASAKKPNPPSRVSGDMRAEKLYIHPLSQPVSGARTNSDNRNRDLMGEDLTDAKAKAWKAMMDANADLYEAGPDELKLSDMLTRISFGDTPNKPRPKPVQTKFASPQWDGQFKGRDRAAPQDTTRSADDRSAAPSPRPQMSRDAALPTDRNPFDPSDIKLGERLRRVVSTASKSNGKPTTSFNFNIPPPPPGPPPKKEKETENGAVKFSAEDWQKTFQEPKWAYPVPAEGRKSPSKGTVRSRRQSIVDAERKKAKKPTTAAVTEETDESEVPQEKTTPRPHDSTPTLPKILTTSDSPDAMDIDSEPATNRSSPRAPRLVPVEPTRIDWRDPFSPTAAKGPLPTAVPNAPQAPTSLPGPPPGPPPKTASQPASAAASRPTSAGADNFNFSGMAAPLNGTSGQSIDNLSDLQTGLPFQSKASDKPPQNSAVPAKKVFELPTEPDPPKPDPSTGVTEALFSRYTSAYALYMAKWQKYEGKILGFLSRRHHDSELRYGEQHLALAATAAVGRSSRGVDVEDHVRELGEEEKVLEVYGAAKKRYRGAMEEFVKAKERVKKSGFAKAH